MSLTITGTDDHRDLVEQALTRLGPDLRALYTTDGLSVRFLTPRERFADIARAYRTCDNMNFAICNGLYDPDEHRIVIAVPSLATVVHELLHHVDHRLGTKRVYHSDENDDIQRAFRDFRRNGFVISAYSMANSREWTCEAMRSLYVNAQPPGRPKTDRERLARIRPSLIPLFESMIERATEHVRARPTENVEAA